MTNPQESGDEAGRADCYKAKQDAIRFLAYRMCSQAEVRRRLEKSYSSHIVEQVLAELQAKYYLDDAAFAQQWRQHRERRRPRGQRVIRQELLQLGVEPEVIQEALEGFDATDNAYRAALTLARRMAGSDCQRFRQRLWPFLQRRGFDAAIIQNVVRQLWQDLANPLHGGVDADAEEQQGEQAEPEGVDQPANDEGG
jgi:regulatory protein